MADFNFYLNRQGVRGNKGEQGEQGFSPYISVNTNTANEYTLDVTNESGTFTTPNLRGNAIEDEGGTYIRYNPETQGMYTGYADTASTTQQGEVTLSTPENLAAGGDGTVPTSGDVFDFVENKISEASVNYVDIEDYTQKMAELDGEINTLDTDKLDFSDLAGALKAGTNITITPNSTTGKITISGEPVDQAQADWDEADTTEPSYIKNKPTIPAAQIQSDWEQADSTALDYIKNKPVIDDELSSTSTNAVQNRLVTNAINLISNNMENLANKGLSNLTSAGDSRLHALKCYEDAGEILTDTEGLADVIKYAHSTYDNAKFISLIHGTPTITSDGLMYGNYDNSVGSGLDMATTLIVVGVENRIKMKYTYAKAGVNGFVQWSAFFRFDSGSNSYGISIREDNTINVVINASNNQVPASTLSLTENQSYIFEIVSDFKTYLKVNVDGTEVYSNTSLSLSYTACSMFHIGNNNSWQGTRYNVGAIDLKYLEVKNNGIPVFNGCVTGIDTYTIGGNTVSIPYVRSKTGAKIADSSARTAIGNLYAQEGIAPYYTLSDTDFTLPQGELYGMIENATTTIPSGVVQSTSITNIVSLTQAEYDLIVPESDTFYIITPSS